MIKQVLALALASMVVAGTAHANARVAAREAVEIASGTKAGRNLFEAMGIKFPENLGALTKVQRGELELAVNAKLQSQKGLADALVSLKAATAGKSGQAAELAAVSVISNTPATAAILTSQKRGNLVDTLVAQQKPVAVADKGGTCNSMMPIPAAAATILVGFKDCGLSQQAQGVAVETAVKAAALDGDASNDAANFRSVLGTTAEGMTTLNQKCLLFSNNVSGQIAAGRM